MRFNYSLILSLSLCGSSFAGVLIDDFTAGPIPLTSLSSTGQNFIQSGLPTDSLLGGHRDVWGRSINSATLELDTTASQFQYDAVQSFGYFTIDYGSETPLNINLTADGSDAFLLSFSDTSIASYNGINKRGLYRFAVSDSTSTHNATIESEMFALDGDGGIVVPFAAFPLIDFSGVTMIRVDAARIEEGSQINLNSISTINLIPEPSTIGSTVVLLGLLLAFRRGIWC